MAYGLGAVVAERFRLVRILGRGGFAIVYEAEDLVTGGRVAVKMLEDEVRDDPEIVERFVGEGRAMHALRTAFVARAHGKGVTGNGTPFLALELLEGKDLGALLRIRERLPWAEAVAYVVQACAGIAAAHDNGIIHRDLKPANLFLSCDGNGVHVHVRVLDFGVAKNRTRAHDLTGPDGVLGTTAYMSPEQLKSARDVDSRSDVWALGVILYRAITGSMPVRGTTTEMIGRILDDEPLPRITQLDVPRELVRVIARALDKNPKGRPPDARAFARALAPFAERSPFVDQAIEELDRAEPSVVVSDDGPFEELPWADTVEIISAPLAYPPDRRPNVVTVDPFLVGGAVFSGIVYLVLMLVAH